jgi:D-alanyl-D-alanine carboxypeptidase
MVLALPGHSEHQLGTALDVVWPGLKVSTKDDRNEMLFRWLEDNAHLYGFVLSYPMKGVEGWPYDNRIYPEVTDFIHEPWHIRYVGVELAEMIYQAGYLDPNSQTLAQDFYQPWP